jgi:hypothetical protein
MRLERRSTSVVAPPKGKFCWMRCECPEKSGSVNGGLGILPDAKMNALCMRRTVRRLWTASTTDLCRGKRPGSDCGGCTHAGKHQNRAEHEGPIYPGNCDARPQTSRSPTVRRTPCRNRPSAGRARWRERRRRDS